MGEATTKRLMEKAEAARIMAESAVGHTMALRACVTLLAAGLPITEQAADPLISALIPPGQDITGEYKSKVLGLVADIATISEELRKRS